MLSSVGPPSLCFFLDDRTLLGTRLPMPKERSLTCSCGVIYESLVNSDVTFVAEVEEFVSCKLGPVACINTFRNPEHVDDVANELHDTLGLEVGHW